MSMNAKFIQIDEAELSRFQADPSLVEGLFEDESLPPAFSALAAATQQRMRAGPLMSARN